MNESPSFTATPTGVAAEVEKAYAQGFKRALVLAYAAVASCTDGDSPCHDSAINDALSAIDCVKQPHAQGNGQ